MSASWLFLMLKSVLCMGAFYLVYSLFLKKDTHFTMNRCYLLITVMLSILLPIFSLNIYLVNVPESYGYLLDVISVGTRMVEDAMPDEPRTFELLTVCYSAGIVVLLTGFLIRIARLLIIISKNGWTEYEGMKLVFLPEGSGSPFSFFRYVFITREHFYSHEVQAMLMHEQVHIRQRHSIDLLLIEMLVILQWFNPFIWLYRKSIKHIHEFIADEGVISQSDDRQAYQRVLLRIGGGIFAYSITNHFNHSLLKRRFIMMNRSKSLPHTRWKIMTIIPVIALWVFVFSDVSGGYLDPSLSAGQPGRSITGSLEDVIFSAGPDILQSALSAPQKQDDSVFTKVDIAPTFKGGQEAMVKFISQNIHYPEAAKKQGIQGTVFVSFMVNEKGKVTNGKVLRGIGSGCEEEALRVVMAMPDWNPGKNGEKPVKVNITLPIKFALSDKDQKIDTGADVKKDTPKDTDPE
ncbi:MAG: M56 family metallopeptidase [Bacteroidales bacterium]|nr:M56 family metallopeptidase [Lentimicrobiaceae bacterium]MDD5694217.1 M56 family metallopeptidase [Bacteroidales bacterium]